MRRGLSWVMAAVLAACGSDAEVGVGSTPTDDGGRTRDARSPGGGGAGGGHVRGDAGRPSDATEATPDAAADTPDSAAATLDATASASDATVVTHDATADVHDATAVTPDTAAATLDSTAAVHDSTAATPDATPAGHDGTAATQDSTAATPDATAATPDATAATPDADEATPDATPDASAPPAPDAGPPPPPLPCSVGAPAAVATSPTAAGASIVAPEIAATDSPVGQLVGIADSRGQVVFDLWRRGPGDADFARWATVLAGHVPPHDDDPAALLLPMPVHLVPTDEGVAAVSGEFGVSVQFVNAAGIPGPLFELTRAASFGAVGLWDEGALAVVWSDFRNGRAEVFFDRIQPDGTRDFPNGLRVAVPPRRVYIDGLSLVRFGDDYLLAYGNNPSSFVQRMTRAGALVGPQIVLDGAAPSLAVTRFGVGVGTTNLFQAFDAGLQPLGVALHEPFPVETVVVGRPDGYLWLAGGVWHQEIRSLTPSGRLAAPPIRMESVLSPRRPAFVTDGPSLSVFTLGYDLGRGQGALTETRVVLGCAAGRACLDDDGACGGEGRCVDEPPSVPPEADPICGCDGLDHTTPFEAASLGIGVAAMNRCGGDRPCMRTADCGADALCRLPDALCGGEGACVPAPADCGGPVCGACDLRDHADACAAAAVGQAPMVPGETYDRVCGLWGNGHERRVCGAPADPAWTPCDAPEAECAPGAQRRTVCPGGGLTVAHCVDGVFGPPSACFRPYPGPCRRDSTLDLIEDIDATMHTYPGHLLPPDMAFQYVDGRLSSGVAATEQVSYVTDLDGRILEEQVDRGLDGDLDAVGRWDWAAAGGPRVSWDEGDDGSVERVDEYTVDAFGRLRSGRWSNGTEVAFTPDGLPFQAGQVTTIPQPCAWIFHGEVCHDFARVETLWDYSCWACDDAGCVDTRECPAAPTEVACGRNGRGRATHGCQNGAGELGPCDDPDTCTDSEIRARRCGEGYQASTCVAGRFEPFAACEAPRPVIPPAPCVESVGRVNAGGQPPVPWETRFDAFGRPTGVDFEPRSIDARPLSLAMGFWRQWRDAQGRVVARDDTRIGYPARGPGRVVTETDIFTEGFLIHPGFTHRIEGDGAPGDPDRPSIVEHFDAEGRLVGWDTDTDRDGVVDGQAWIQYGPDGTGWRTNGRPPGPVRSARLRFDAAGRLVEEAEDSQGDGSFDGVTRIDYASDGGVTYTDSWGRSVLDALGRAVRTEFGNADAGYRVVFEQTFDDDGRLVHAVGDANFGDRTFDYACWDCDVERCVLR